MLTTVSCLKKNCLTISSIQRKLCNYSIMCLIAWSYANILFCLDNGYQTFAAVVGEFSSNDPIILRKESPTLYSNSLWLNGKNNSSKIFMICAPGVRLWIGK